MKEERLNAIGRNYKLEQKGSEERAFCTVKMLSVAYFDLVFACSGVLMMSMPVADA